MARLGENRYGKSRVRLSRITRHGERHEFDEWSVRVLLQGDFDASFTEADNSSLLPTDTMKNTVYSIARNSNSITIEAFAMELGDYLLKNNPHVSKVGVEIESKAWERVVDEGGEEATTFKLGGPELATVNAAREQGGEWAIHSGIDGLVILKTTKSAFTGYIKDRLTTLPESTDRIFGTRATVAWDYIEAPQNYGAARATALATLLRVFAEHNSLSVQHTLYDIGEAMLAAVPEMARVKLTMPNLHCNL